MKLINGKGASSRIHLKKALSSILVFVLFLTGLTDGWAQRQMELLDRGVVAVYSGNGNALVSWRIFADDSPSIAFNVYAKVNGGAATLKNATPISGKSNMSVSGINVANTNEYYVVPVINGEETTPSKSFTLNGDKPYISIPLNAPASGVTPAAEVYDYSANDCSAGDLDGDGSYEIILKWDPSNSKDNANNGYTGNVFIDAYKIDGTRLWRIDLGKNIRAGAHYTQFLVYDFDGDGKAELVCKTADGTVDGKGNVIGDASKDYRSTAGRILSGPEFLTVFDGETGEALATTKYIPQRYPNKDNISGSEMDAMWGDNYGNRMDRFLACVAYLDGKRPSIVMCRGYYTRTVLAAFNWRKGTLSKVWTFDSLEPGNSDYAGQGNHNVSVADVDADGKDEIIYGSMAIDDNGKGLYSTKLGHGDAMHVSDFIPSRPGMESFHVHEEHPNPAGVEMRDVATGKKIWGIPGNSDIGRGVAFDIDPTNPGAECWASEGTGIHSCADGSVLSTTYPTTAGNGATYNMGVWWDGDLLRELVDKTVVTKWNWTRKSTDRIYSVYNDGVGSNNYSKSNPCLVADILGDWREEMIFRNSESTELRIFATAIGTTYGIYTLMHDPVYRLGIAWQNVGYNQPAHTGFFLGADMDTPPVPSSIYVSVDHTYPTDNTVPVLSKIEDQKLDIGESNILSLPDFSLIAEVTDPVHYNYLFTQTPEVGTELNVLDGPVDVSLSVNDGNGNISNIVTFKVSFADLGKPIITKAYPDHNVRSTGDCKGVVPDYTTLVQAMDYGSTNLTITQVPDAGTVLSGDGDNRRVTVTVDDNNGNSIDTSWVVTLSAPGCFAAGVSESGAETLVVVYPSPAKDFITIDGAISEEGTMVSILDLKGSIFAQYPNLVRGSVIDVSSLETGVYMVKVETENEISIVKFVKE